MRLESFLRMAALALALLLPAVVSGQAMHPVFSLLDEQGGNVLVTARAVSAAKTCGQCHDSDYIAAHATTGHADQMNLATHGIERLERAGRMNQGGAPSSAAAMNCFLCHLASPNNEARLAALAGGQAEWSTTATLEGSGMVLRVSDRWHYQRSAFSPQGTLLPHHAQMRDPENHHCGFCHGHVHTRHDEPVLIAAGDIGPWSTFTTGQVIAPQKISESGLNLAGKERLVRAWDVHAERLLDCVSCHFSVNNPAHQQADPARQPGHLAYSPRRLDIRQYLHQPSHILAGSATLPAGSALSVQTPMRRCEGCHDFDKAHPWLPFKARHRSSLTCETCHIPQLYAPAAATIDLAGTGTHIVYRGGTPSGDVIHELVSGYRPLILPRRETDGSLRLAPYNLITTWTHGSTETGKARPVSAEVQPWAIHHNVTHGAFVVRDCQTCHDRHSMLSATFFLSTPRSGGTIELWPESAGVLPAGELVHQAEGFYFTAKPGTAGFYILGHSSVPWVQWLGGVLLLLVLAGIALHAFLRIRAHRHAEADGEETRLLYLYEPYERYWHWLQALLIIGLILTGLTIHAPGRFAWMSFAAAVRVHNVLAALLLFNAFLSLFYHFASGKIKTYLPEPEGFFNQMFAQAGYYLSGIFKGEAHPFEKSQHKKLNPLQKITYLVILNILLPLQIITGLLIAGAQEWPAISRQLGGLGFLVPFHSLLAWLFAAFLILHIYLTTTGHTPLSSIKAMITGWEKVPVHPEEK